MFSLLVLVVGQKTVYTFVSMWLCAVPHLSSPMLLTLNKGGREHFNVMHLQLGIHRGWDAGWHWILFLLVNAGKNVIAHLYTHFDVVPSQRLDLCHILFMQVARFLHHCWSMQASTSRTVASVSLHEYQRANRYREWRAVMNGCERDIPPSEFLFCCLHPLLSCLAWFLVVNVLVIFPYLDADGRVTVEFNDTYVLQLCVIFYIIQFILVWRKVNSSTFHQDTQSSYQNSHVVFFE